MMSKSESARAYERYLEAIEGVIEEYVQDLSIEYIDWHGVVIDEDYEFVDIEDIDTHSNVVTVLVTRRTTYEVRDHEYEMILREIQHRWSDFIDATNLKGTYRLFQ